MNVKPVMPIDSVLTLPHSIVTIAIPHEWPQGAVLRVESYATQFHYQTNARNGCEVFVAVSQD